MLESISISQTFLVLPSDANAHSTLFGGRLLAVIDMTAGIAAMRRARGQVVTACMDRVDFMRPVHVGDIVTVTATLIKEGKTSMQFKVESMGYKKSGEEIGLICSALVTMVAVDDNGKPRALP